MQLRMICKKNYIAGNTVVHRRHPGWTPDAPDKEENSGFSVKLAEIAQRAAHPASVHLMPDAIALAIKVTQKLIGQRMLNRTR